MYRSKSTQDLLPLLPVGMMLLFAAGGCGRRTAVEIPPPLTDVPLAAFQRELLEAAFDTATAIPVDPHIKDRSRVQEAVVAACLQLRQPARAIGYIEKIDNWRRGSCYADLAFYCAEHGPADAAQQFLELAEEATRGDLEEWRIEQIAIKRARARAQLKQTQLSAAGDDLGGSAELSPVAEIEGIVSDNGAWEDQIKALDTHISTGNFDVVRSALAAYGRLFDRFYADSAKRCLTEDRIRASWGTLPVLVRIDLLIGMAEAALRHADEGKALSLTDDAQALFKGAQWPNRHRIPLAARLAALHFRAGNAEKARSDADAALALFETEAATIVNVDRAGVLRPLAAAYQAMGDTAAARSVYKRAIEEGIANPNSRPRAEDLSATCCSMALSAVEPDAELWALIHQIREALGQPW